MIQQSIMWAIDQAITRFGAEHCTRALCRINACPACGLLHWKEFFIAGLLFLAVYIYVRYVEKFKL